MARKFQTHASLGTLLQPLLTRMPPALRTIGELRLNWVKWMGERTSQHSVPVFFDGRGGKLTLYCDSPEWTTALTVNAASILENIPARYGVQSLRCVFKKGGIGQRVQPPAPPDPLPPLTPGEQADIHGKVESLGLDRATGEAIESFLSLCARRRKKYG